MTWTDFTRLPDPRAGASLLALPLLLALGCSSKSSPSSSAPAPVATSEVQAFSHITNLTPVQVSVGSTTGWGIVDTGDPVVELDPAVFTSASSAEITLPAITVASTTVHNVLVLGSDDGLTSPDPSFPLAANIGCGALCGRVASFNYRDVTFALGSAAPSPPSGLLAETVLGFSFEGGSGGGVPRSRVIVTVNIEGTDHSMMLDSGASYVTLTEASYSAITSDGRAQISLTRVKSVAVGGAEVTSMVVAHSSAFDTIIGNVSTDVGHTIDGSLGGTFLNHFYVTIDYPNTQLHLAPYSDHSFAIDPAENLGFSLGTFPGGGYGVAEVLAGSAAESKGVEMGDAVLEVGGQSLASLTASEAVELLFGSVGSSKTVMFGSGPSLANQSVTLEVQEFLPLPTTGGMDGGAKDGSVGD
jgi:hypothetical protein